MPAVRGTPGRTRHAGMMRLGTRLLALLAFALPLAAGAESAASVPRLCFLTFDPGPPESTRFAPFFQDLRDLGWVDGQTITIEFLSADGRGERFPAISLCRSSPEIRRREDELWTSTSGGYDKKSSRILLSPGISRPSAEWATGSPLTGWRNSLLISLKIHQPLMIG